MMIITPARSARRHPRHRRGATGMCAVATAAVAAVALAACGSSKSTSSTGTTASTPTTATAIAPPVSISSAEVAGVGTVLVNSKGMTLYLLTSEAGGKLTCTDANGCTKVWPDTELPPGQTSAMAGSGVDASKLGTVKGTSGALYVTYAGWPLYTFSHDSGAGTANGQGVMSFGGTWQTLTPAGTPVTGAKSGSSSTTAATAKPYGY